MAFEPIAIVGRGCALPGALDPDIFWRGIAAGRTGFSQPSAEQFRAPTPLVPHGGGDLPLTGTGGYVHGFDDVFDPEGFQLPAEDVRGLDTSMQWVLHSARAALTEAGGDGGPFVPGGARTGLVLGVLSCPTPSMTRYAEEIWLSSAPRDLKSAVSGPSEAATDPRHRFMAGLSAQLVARALGLAEGYGVEAACASSLYAIKLACDRLHDGTADLMLAGACNGTDALLVHMAFQAVSALSPSGRSRPFHKDANGLVPAQGAAVVALMRLSQALDEGVPVLGVIRGVGLSNDGRAGSLLTPDSDGQVRAMRQAYELAGVSPDSVSFVECHATGTALGDSAEVRSMQRVFTGAHELAIGSAKANVGHSFAAAGLVGLLKMLGALNTGVRPPTPGLDEPAEALAGSGLRVVTEPELWPGPRRGAVSSFGFGGNNAHLVVDAWQPGVSDAPVPPPPARKARGPVAIVSIGARVGQGDSLEDFRRSLFTASPSRGPRKAVEAVLDGLRFPPRDMASALGQQTLLLEAAREAAAHLDLPRERTSVLVGMGVDPDAARWSTQERIRSWTGAGAWAEEDRERAADAVSAPLDAAGVLGTIPNIVVNRVNAQLDVAGPSYAVLAEEASGVVALEQAARALRRGEIDAAVVGAVDLSCEPVHEAAAAALGLTEPPGDAAVVFVLKRAEDARRDNDPVIALLDDPDDDDPDGDAPNSGPGDGAETAEGSAADGPDLLFGPEGFDTAALFGAAHAARALVDVAAAALALRHQARPLADGPAAPALDARTALVRVRSMAGSGREVRLRADKAVPWLASPPPRPHVYSGPDRAGVVKAAEAGTESDTGPARLVVLAADEEQLAHRRARAVRWLTGRALPPAGVAFREEPVTGGIAFVYSGGISAYPDMGRDLLLAFPEESRQLTGQAGLVRSAAEWAYEAGTERGTVSVERQILGTGMLSCVHTLVSRQTLGLAPDVVLGYSAGESTALFALGVWPEDIADYVREMSEVGLWTREIAGEFRAVGRVRERAGVTASGWATYIVGAGEREAREAVADEPAVHLVSVNAPRSVVVGGEPSGCERVLARLPSAYAVRVPYELAVHVPEANEIRDMWRQLHHRTTEPLPGVRFYTCGAATSYEPTREACANALTSQAMATMDFAGTVEQAWQDGARIFVEHGPRRLCSDWISATLGDRTHVAVALDNRLGGELSGAALAVAELMAAGVPVDADAFFGRHAEDGVAGRAPARTATFPAHCPVVVLPERSGEPALPGPSFDRAQLEYAATGRLSTLFGPLFAEQDGYRRQTRMPSPPMLLVDRVTGIDAEPATMGTGTIWTETDVRATDWYTDYAGRMAASLMMEAGQADLLLISYLGADLLSRGERVYRLLGCEVTLHGPLARAGERLRFEITIDGHAEHGGMRLFFFHFDGYVGDDLRMTVRSGQAGFFTDEELAGSEGVLFNPSSHVPVERRVDPPLLAAARSFGPEQIRAFADGRPVDCFGPAWSATSAHVLTPRIGNGQLLLIDEVTDFDPRGGPWGRGWIRARRAISPDDWFFPSHFHNDPCMPGTLMFEGCFQAMSFYLTALGTTVDRDGWRFEPVPHRAYRMHCRGQVTPSARELTYEVLVKEVHTGPEPLLVADLLCTVDGLKSFHAPDVALRLVPDSPR